MIYPNTKVTAAQTVTRQVTASEAAVLRFIYQNRAAHSCELTRAEDIVLGLLQAGMLHCRTTRIGQIICLSPQGNIQISRPEMRVISPAVSINTVYHRAALKLAMERGFQIHHFFSPLYSQITDGQMIHRMVLNAAMGGPSGTTLIHSVLDMKKNRENGYVIVVSSDIERYDHHLKLQPMLRAWKLTPLQLSDLLNCNNLMLP